MDKKSDTQGYLKRKAAAPAFCNVQDQLRMFPVGILVGRHIELTAFDLAEAEINRTQFELAIDKTHGLAAIAASAALVKHQRPMFGLQAVDQLSRGRCGNNQRFMHGDLLMN
jgi:hypothetical protein